MRARTPRRWKARACGACASSPSLQSGQIVCVCVCSRACASFVASQGVREACAPHRRALERAGSAGLVQVARASQCAPFQGHGDEARKLRPPAWSEPSAPPLEGMAMRRTRMHALGRGLISGPCPNRLHCQVRGLPSARARVRAFARGRELYILRERECESEREKRGRERATHLFEGGQIEAANS